MGMFMRLETGFFGNSRDDGRGDVKWRWKSLCDHVWFWCGCHIRSADTGVANPNVDDVLQQVGYIKKEEIRC
ncbi:hypothetical protein DRO03_04270 [Methanosarcinales archaeon]|nr:MAG: hypothetical protein DRO03_04270 [Methanosarcinales archaeon]